MKPVHLSRALTLEEATPVSDGMGGFTKVWASLGTLWAEILPGTGRDTAGEEVVLSTVPYRITVRGAPQGAASRPKVGQRFRDGTRFFAILAVTERDAGGAYLVCFVREEVPT
ncbi:head-tail adaptor protein [Pseudorhodobacter sp. E13]|uniref:head-tail adaptor protein n=1 Tax=Pseudorhodobacter sp. E13 TaxID=2487931 RepID=UPI000F8F666A|nr:head-tail adaptor protein [Pseudorhodobacter sp. E13]RUS60450.1 head-tail adaptor protein [Pseudorhodobacter sp. E13]